MKLNKKGRELFDIWQRNYCKENDKLGGNSANGDFVEGWCIIDNFDYIKNITDECGLLIFGYDDDAISVVDEWLEEGDCEIGNLGFSYTDVKNELLKYFEDKFTGKTAMENILKELNGKQFGNKYCFSRNNEKFVATLDYSGAIDYGWRDLIRVSQIDNKYSNVFKFEQGSFRDGEVKYYDDKLGRFVIVTDFSAIINEIIDWIDFMTI